MPIYEYRCEPCDHAFETLIRGRGDSPHCPKCGGVDLDKQFSVPAASQSQAGERGSMLPMAGGCGPMGCAPMGGCGSGMCSPN